MTTKKLNDNQWLTQTYIAHRGLHFADAPENSMAAFERAIEAGYAIEIDVHLSADGVPVVFHDHTLARMCGRDNLVTELTLSELSECRLAGTEQRIPTLEQVLALCDGKAPLLIELKTPKKIGILESAVWALLKDYRGLFAVQSFNPYTIKWFAKNAPQVLRGQLAATFKDSDMPAYQKYLLSRLKLAPLNKPDFIAYDTAALPNVYVARSKRRGRAVLAWTVRSAEEFERIAPFADNIIFENFTPAPRG